MRITKAASEAATSCNQCLGITPGLLCYPPPPPRSQRMDTILASRPKMGTLEKGGDRQRELPVHDAREVPRMDHRAQARILP